MANTPPMRLLIVDDDDQLRETLARRFQRQGMIVTEACDGERVLAEQHRFDVALLDLHMPGMNGIELLDKLKARQTRPGSHPADGSRQH